MERVSPILLPNGEPFRHPNGKARPELLAALAARRFGGRLNLINTVRRGKLTADAIRDTEQYRRHWANADALDADSANNRTRRHKAIHRSRYEESSNGVYDGMLGTHTNAIVGIGPKLRMKTTNRDFNQLIEREFEDWSLRVGLRRKLWCMGHARYQDGEGFMLMVTDEAAPDGQVALDLLPIEAEQCQTPYPPAMEVGYIDGIRFDPDNPNRILWYDVLPYHPGGQSYVARMDAIRIAPRNMLHWFKLKRPGTHRGMPACLSSLNLGADSRRFREAVIAKAETQADFTVMLKSLFDPDPNAPDFSMDAFEIEKRMAVTMPNGLDPVQLKNDTPTAEYTDFTRCQDREFGAPIQQPVNVVQKDSSQYSFASGKLDTLMYGVEADVERADCDELVMDKIFVAWFAEWSLLHRGFEIPDSDRGPNHQWDWPAKPVIDAVAESSATDIELKNGSTTLRSVHSKKGEDYEDNLRVMAEDHFGDASDENVAKARLINLLKNTPAHAIQYVAVIAGVELPQAVEPRAAASLADLSHTDLRRLKSQLATVEAL